MIWIADYVIYFYIFICITLLLYNLLYIICAEAKNRRQERRKRRWLKEMQNEWSRLREGKGISFGHRRRMTRKLEKIEQLMAYNEAVLECLEQDEDGIVQYYLDECGHIFRALAVEYGKKPVMERAFYAYLMSVYHPNRENEGRLPTILLNYFEGSTIFCRENVLQALYAMGNAGAVERALALMNDRGWYHHTRLLSDGLNSFAGDKKALASQLWRRCLNWQENFQVAVVQFATKVSGDFVQEFLTALKNENLPLETRFSLMRYFQRYIYPPVKPVLHALLAEEHKSDLAITAAAVLEKYPGRDTQAALMRALHSRNWYIRRNAAASLVSLGADESVVKRLNDGGDRYAAEMLAYMLEENKISLVLSPEEKEKTAVGVGI